MHGLGLHGAAQRPAKRARPALVSRHRSSVGLRWPSKRIAALHRLPIRAVLAARCALRCAPMAARSLRHLISDTTLGTLQNQFFQAAGAVPFGGRRRSRPGGASHR
ncbi:hypothetical protein D8B34_03190 [Verminephrobacter eiseniae]|nr:hypothetical protein [Verminephrobacter eiseniae]MCW8223438.1 hypothetical protein [Verminephrobacter eiseniae]MCW8232832.1 hypothetical protein [Verminephrobacter eiseniae]